LRKKRTSGRRKSNSYQPSEKRWLEQHLRLWLKLERLKRSSRLKSC